MFIPVPFYVLGADCTFLCVGGAGSGRGFGPQYRRHRARSGHSLILLILVFLLIRLKNARSRVTLVVYAAAVTSHERHKISPHKEHSQVWKLQIGQTALTEGLTVLLLAFISSINALVPEPIPGKPNLGTRAGLRGLSSSSSSAKKAFTFVVH